MDYLDADQLHRSITASQTEHAAVGWLGIAQRSRKRSALLPVN